MDSIQGILLVRQPHLREVALCVVGQQEKIAATTKFRPLDFGAAVFELLLFSIPQKRPFRQ